MWVAIAARVVIVVIVSRGWFFTNDDWDFVTRDGVGQMFAQHQGHINVFNALAALVLRKLVGIDYWPGYGLFVALAWPALGLVAWWIWRRRGVDPLLASGGAILLVWLGSVAYMQFSHVNPAWALAATLVALEFDERRISWRNTSIGFGVSLIAVFANTVGALVALARLFMALFRRQWNGAITAGTSLVIYAVVRSAVTDSLDLSFGLGDVIPALRVTLNLVGQGLHTVIPFPGGLEILAGLVLLQIAVGVVIWSRFSYHATALVLGAGIWLESAVVVGYLNSLPTWRFELLYSGVPVDHVIWSRFANVVIVAVVLAGMPLLSAHLRGRRIRSGAMAGVAVLVAGMLAFNVVQTLNVFERISDKSRPLAEIAGGLLIVASGPEPALDLSGPRHQGTRAGSYQIVRIADGTFPEIDQTMRSGLVSEPETLAWLAASDLVDSMFRSDIYEAQDVAPDTGWARALSRFYFRGNSGVVGSSWGDLGLDRKGCVLVSRLEPMPVARTVAFRLRQDRDNPVPMTEPIVLQLEDDYGHSEIGLAVNPDNEGDHRGTWVVVLGPEAGIGPTTLTITGPPDTVICLKQVPRQSAP